MSVLKALVSELKPWNQGVSTRNQGYVFFERGLLGLKPVLEHWKVAEKGTVAMHVNNYDRKHLSFTSLFNCFDLIITISSLNPPVLKR